MKKESLVEIYNILGSKVYSAISDSGLETIDMSKGASGIYFVKIISENNSITKKIIKN